MKYQNTSKIPPKTGSKLSKSTKIVEKLSFLTIFDTKIIRFLQTLIYKTLLKMPALGQNCPNTPKIPPK